ncbi:M14 family metallopeptidase [Kangiella sp. TOML190]|uniref:M14 family metallopeptidase n=1 Tax=Kangiella sp. TOML190 TaxID=2931351 RepID=UPI00203A4D91|nr:M14 family metallopeptidase [Kangiella sp. TOML190]
MISLLVGTSLTVTADDKDQLDYYFNQTIDYDPAVHKPSDSLGYAIGDWHLRPDQSLAYFKALAASSDKVILQATGYSHQQRPLIAAFISSAANLAKLNQIQVSREQLQTEDTPNVVYLGYSVHGNEASGANAAPLVAYRLAASQESWVQELLANNIVIIDPMLNPDGMDRFANWVNRYKGMNLVADPASAEHNEAWPSGRTNHYWFDLNRDWLLLQHPESRARVKLFYQWRPNIVGDFHEMGTNATYFFQPGVPSRQNPLTPNRNFELTNEIAKYHAKALDTLNVPYYSKESFDDFYYGKGSTFPDINGGVGILFEQASARGHLQESINGDLSFPFAIRNQVATSFSTLEAANSLQTELKNYQKNFFHEQKNKAAIDSQKSIIFSSNDPARLDEFIEILRQHQIEVSQVTQEAVFNRHKFPPNRSYLVKLGQTQYGLIRAMFETRTEFQDNTFYDVSAWTLPLAFNLDYRFLNQTETASVTSAAIEANQGQWLVAEQDITLAFSTDNFYALKFANQLLKKGIGVKTALKPFNNQVQGKTLEFPAGTLLVVNQPDKKSQLQELWLQYGQPHGIDIKGLSTGFSQAGIDLGSPNVRNLKSPKPLLLIGKGVSSYEAGEVWHLLDKRFGIGVSMQAASKLKNIDLSGYSHLIMVAGRYPKLEQEELKPLKAWITNGGHLIASRSAIEWLSKHEIISQKLLQEGKKDTDDAVNKVPSKRPFSDRSKAFAERLIGGAIFKTELDLTHPLTFGINRQALPVTKAGVQVLAPIDEDFKTVAHYAKAALMAGYASEDNLEKIAQTPAVVAYSQERGSIILFNDNPLFRGYWLGSARLFINGLFYNDAF